MAKGKYAARADRRCEFTGLEERAVAAERDRDRLAAELAELRETSGSQISSLRVARDDAREQRDTATAPRVAELEKVNSRLRAERNNALDVVRGEMDYRVKLQRRLMDYLIDVHGFGGPEAKETAWAISDAKAFGERFISNTGTSSSNPRIVEALQRARGLRGQRNRAAEATPDLPARLKTPELIAKIKQRCQEEEEAAIDSLLPVYAFDGPESSLMLSLDNDLSLRVYIEHAEADVLTDAGLAGIRIPPEERGKLAQAIMGARTGHVAADRAAG